MIQVKEINIKQTSEIICKHIELYEQQKCNFWGKGNYAQKNILAIVVSLYVKLIIYMNFLKLTALPVM